VLHEVIVGGEEEAAGAAGGVGDGFARLGRDAGDHGFDERAGREVLAGARLCVFGVLFEDAFVDVALRIGVEGDPGDIVHHLDEAGELGGGPGSCFGPW
jgi:hypothetical protein